MPEYESKYDFETKTYAALLHTASHLIDSAEKRAEGSLLDLQAATVFLAFTFEAYLNHVGAKEIPFWEEIDRISNTEKLAVLSKQLGFKPDKSKRPFQTIKGLFELRNGLAHGRTERVKKTVLSKTPPADGDIWRLLPAENLTTKGVRRDYADVKEAIETINKSRPTPETGLWTMGVRSYSRRTINP